MSTLRRKIAALPNAERIPKRWLKMKAVKESRHEGTVWKKNPIKVVHTPSAVKVFRQLNSRLRSLMWDKLGRKVTFDPKRLVTYQPVVSSKGIMVLAENEKLAKKKKVYVLGTEKGPCIWNGNHRAVGAMLSGKQIEVLYLNLTGSSKCK